MGACTSGVFAFEALAVVPLERGDELLEGSVKHNTEFITTDLLTQSFTTKRKRREYCKVVTYDLSFGSSQCCFARACCGCSASCSAAFLLLLSLVRGLFIFISTSHDFRTRTNPHSHHMYDMKRDDSHDINLNIYLVTRHDNEDCTSRLNNKYKLIYFRRSNRHRRCRHRRS